MSEQRPGGHPKPKKPWKRPSLRTHQSTQPTVLLACTRGFPVDCYPLDGFHHCERNACGCLYKPPNC